ncbi:hypothetical protein HanIR_Chr02g0091881 [Helianthus annuus]|nr:hypothetical protein HanIR_Chr02g0091881 [Helianthus annuus]
MRCRSWSGKATLYASYSTTRGVYKGVETGIKANPALHCCLSSPEEPGTRHLATESTAGSDWYLRMSLLTDLCLKLLKFMISW